MNWKILLTIAFLISAANWVQRPGGRHSHAEGVFVVFADTNSGGEAIFKQNCTPCHGEDGKGKAAVGTPDFTSAKLQASLTDQYILNTITNGKTGTIMPAWKGKLSEEQISAVASYVRSLGGGGRSK